MELTDKKWKTFNLKDLFEIERGTRLKQSDRVNGDIPLVTAGKENSGVAGFVTPTINKKYTNKITIDMFGTSFYHSESFICDDNILVLFEKELLSTYSKKFIVAIISQDCYKHDFIRQYRQKDFVMHDIMLPIDDNGNPDWEWIEQYMKSLEEGLDDQMNDIIEVADGDKNIIKVFADKVEIDDFKAWLQDNANMDADHQMSLDDVKWKDFKISDLFDVTLSKGDIKLSKMERGNVRLISSGKENNGLVGFIDENGDGKADIFEANCLTVDMFDNAFYQPKAFYSVSHGRVNMLLPKFHLTSNIGLFMSTLITKEQYKHDYRRAVYSNVIAEMNIKLPVDANDNPDWEWIEQYMKSLPYSDKEVEVA